MTLPAAWPMLDVPVVKTFSSCLSWSSRAESAADWARVSAASRVRKPLDVRVTVCTRTPLPKKPAPVYWPPSLASCTSWRE